VERPGDQENSLPVMDGGELTGGVKLDDSTLRAGATKGHATKNDPEPRHRFGVMPMSSDIT
jgi:hypothetical protein